MTRGRTQAMWTAPAEGGPRKATSVEVAPQARIPDDHPARGLVGRILDDRFSVDDVLATGGMSVLYAATDNVLERPVVVKVMRTTGNDASAARRLVREARSASRLQHPSIVTVFHLGLLETQEPYIVLERLVGHDLEEHLRRHGPFTPREVGATLAPIADALHTLHDASIVHRDVKPANIFLLEGRIEAPRVKLVDFGLAYLDQVATERLTRQGFVLGTPEYLAPECAKGLRAEPSADVYALAVSAYELLTGAPPFEGPALDVMLQKTSRDAPPIASRLDLELGELGELLDRALSRRPGPRPSMEALGRALWAVAQEGPVARSSAEAREPDAHATDGGGEELPASGTRRRAPPEASSSRETVPMRTGTIVLDTREIALLRAADEPPAEAPLDQEAPSRDGTTSAEPTSAPLPATTALVSPRWVHATAVMTLLFLATLALLLHAYS